MNQWMSTLQPCSIPALMLHCKYPTHAACPTQIQLEQGPSIRLHSHKVENSRTKSNPLAIGLNIAKTKPEVVKPYERRRGFGLCTLLLLNTHWIFFILLIEFTLLCLLAFQLDVHCFVNQVPQNWYSFGTFNKWVLRNILETNKHCIQSRTEQ